MTRPTDLPAAERHERKRLLAWLRLLPATELQPLPERLAIGVVCGVVAVLVRLPLEPLLSGSVPFVFFIPGVMVAAVKAGAAAAVPASLVGMIYLGLTAPDLGHAEWSLVLPFLLFILSCILVTAIAEELRSALDRLRREEAAHRFERGSLQAVFKSAPVGLSLSEAPSGRSILINDEMRRILGRQIDGADIDSDLIMHAVHADGRPYELQDYPPVRSVQRGEEVRAEPLTFVRPNGSHERAEISSTPLRDSKGAIHASVTVLVDVEAREKAIEHQRLITDELAHRMKNTLAMVQAIVSQTLRTSLSTAAARTEIMERLGVLSRAQDALTRSSWTSATLGDTVAAALEPLALGPDRLLAEGPEVRLGSRAALSFTLALHELATNAVKYGALLCPSGRVDITWSVEADPEGARLVFCWRETGGPEVSIPARRGFGSRLIDSVSKTFAGESRLQFDSTGLSWKVTARIKSLQEF